ncbi:MAG: D-2-hydroxyacid dehydrogenase [Gammaproteobacteria bacterium]
MSAEALHTIVFLDRDSLIADLRRPAFAHRWSEYPATDPADVVARLAGATIAITNKVPIRAAELAQLPDLKMIAIAATGANIIDLEACRARGIVVANIRNYSLVSVPEHCFALMLALRRNLRAYCADVEAGRWQQSTRFCLLDHPIGDLAGSTLGIVGYGALGRRVAQIGRAFGMRVVAHSRSRIGEPDVTELPLDELLRVADVVSLHLPLTPASRQLIGADQLARMKPGALLINTARGGLVDEAALARALQDGVIGGAAFDVLSQEPPRADNPLLALRLPNFILTPHVAWASRGAMQTLADMLVDNVEAFVHGVPINTL